MNPCLPERIRRFQSATPVVADDDRLPVTPARASADGIVNPYHGVANLVQAPGVFKCRAVVDALSIRMAFSAPVAVVVALSLIHI